MNNAVEEVRTMTDKSNQMNHPSDPKKIASTLAQDIEGEVRFDDGSRALYATDASNYRQVPIGVVIPKNRRDVITTVQICRGYGLPVLSRGGGTSLAGQCCNFAVVMDMSKYFNKVLEVAPEKRLARVEPGLVLDDLQGAVWEHGLVFAPDPSTHNRCTLGGMIGNNSCGVHSVLEGRTSENVEELEVLTYDGEILTLRKTPDDVLDERAAENGRQGEIYRRLRDLRNRHEKAIRKSFPRIPRRVSGYNLDELLPENGFHLARALVGTEGTCATILSATVRLVVRPEARVLLVAGFEDAYVAADHTTDMLKHKPSGLEGLDEFLIRNIKAKEMQQSEALPYLPEGNGWLICEFSGKNIKEAKQKASAALRDLQAKGRLSGHSLLEDEKRQEKIWEVRESGLGATAFVPGRKDTWPGWEDSAVPPEKMGTYLRELRGLMNEFDYEGSFYGHFGDGCLHTRISFDLETKEGVRKYRTFIDRAADLVIRHGGSLSGEHGDGQCRGELLEKMFGAEIVTAFREFKAIWDPDNKMNPGKVVDPYPVTEDIKLQLPLKYPDPDTYFSFADDEHNFAHAALRCVGVGACRRGGGGTMCPSYMVTREEKHSTRGRARLLYEMLEGDTIKEGWQEDHVRDALDLCLACKGCKSDCPVNVDMATYKAEFLAHYYESRRRPLSAYALGWIHRWAWLGSWMPAVTNFVAQTPATSIILKRAAGIARERKIPRFAAKPFFRDFHPQTASGRKRVILWADTFNNYFYPGILHAGSRVLHKLGYQVEIPSKRLCCGRPLYDYGMLKLARKLLLKIMAEMRQEIEEGIPIIGLEPSCTAVFRDELLNLFPDSELAKKLSSQFFTLAEFLERYAPDLELNEMKGKAIVHGHCHHKSIMGMEADEWVYDKTGLDCESLDSGCCGMAGAFGFEEEHYDVSVACGERMILPRARLAADSTLIMTDGFSCREQISQLTGREAVHLAQLLDRCLAK